jgi:hypothetical protein
MNTFLTKAITAGFLAVALLTGCQKQLVNEYEIVPVHVDNQGGKKGTLKTDLQFITIMYADLFGTSIPSAELNNINQAYLSFGDKDVVIERIAQHFLLNSAAQIPTDNYMRFNTDQFIAEAYNRFYVRKPTEAETYYLRKLIKENGEIKARDVFYAFVTAEEYKYY